MFSALMARAVKIILNDYLSSSGGEGDADDVSYELHRGSLRLHDQHFRADAFDHHFPGFRLKNGRLGQLVMTLDPATLRKDKPVFVTADAIHLLFTPIDPSEMTAVALERTLAEWLLNDTANGLTQKLFGSRKLIHYCSDTIYSRVLLRVLQNTQLFITDIEVSFELPERGGTAERGCFRFHLESVHLTGGGVDDAVTPRRDVQPLHDTFALSKRLGVTGLSATWRPSLPADLSATCPDEVIIKPASCELRMRITLNHAARTLATRLHLLFTTPLLVRTNALQLHDLAEIIAHLESYTRLERCRD